MAAATRPEVGLEAGLRRAVVVRRDDQHAVDAERRPPGAVRLRRRGAVSLVPVPGDERHVDRARARPRHSSTCSSSVSTGPRRWCRRAPDRRCPGRPASRRAPPRRRGRARPRRRTGVTIAVSTGPNRAISQLPPLGIGVRSTLDAERGEQVLVQLEPHGVVRVDHRLGEPVGVAPLDLGQAPRTGGARSRRSGRGRRPGRRTPAAPCRRGRPAWRPPRRRGPGRCGR